MTSRPLNHLHAAGHMYPGAWTQVDVFRQSRGVDLPKWPAWCFLPMAGWYAIVSGGGDNRVPLHMVGDVAQLAAIGTWRYSQGIYRFDDDAGAALADTLLVGEMPTDVLLRLPEWSVYIETPGRQWLNDTLYGFWAHLEWDVNTERRELRLLLDTEEALVPQILHLGPWTVTEAVDRFVTEAGKQAGLAGLATPKAPEGGIEAMSAAIQPLLALVLYLCSDEPEIDDRQHPGERPGRPRPKKTKKGWRLFPPKKPRVWSVGEQIGETLRRHYASEPTGRTVRPHLRRAHWHGYWTGPRDGERKFSYKWLPPTVVAGER